MTKRENTGNETTTYNPQKPGTVEKVEPNTGDTTQKPVTPAKR